MNTPLDLAFGSLLALAGAAFGVVGFVIGLRNNPHMTQWYVAALILGVLAGAVLLDEAASKTATADRRLGAWLGTLLLLGGLGAGTVGFILGLAGKAHPLTWLIGGLVLAILSLAATLDELRRWRTLSTRVVDAFSGLGLLFGLLGLGLGIVGFILGLMSRAHADTWLWAAVVSSTVAAGWSIEAEHRALLEEHPLETAEMPSRLNRERTASP
jgi:MFS family permease